MPLRLAQLRPRSQPRRLAAWIDDRWQLVRGVNSTLELANQAIGQGCTLDTAIGRCGLDGAVDMERCLANDEVMAGIDHPDDAHLTVSVTGLTHLGSAQSRDRMHRKLADAETLSDSMKLFKLGIDDGKPEPGRRGAQPEWLWRGDGSSVRGPGERLHSPDFALDAGEEPEIVGVYVIGPDRTPYRLGYVLGNEFSDHVTERINYLYLSHSKLRECAIGGELRAGPLPAAVQGRTRILRNGAEIWAADWLSGEDNMCHSLDNLEGHHFKYDGFRRPGDVHLHFFGTATISFADGLRSEPGDVFEITADAFQLPLRNRWQLREAGQAAVVPL